MNLLHSLEGNFFLDEIFTHIFTNFRHKYENVKVVLPTGFLCSELQLKFLSKKDALILPSIITLGEIVAEGNEILKLPHVSMGSYSPLEEKVVLGEIISSYPNFNFNLAAGIKFAPELARLFYEIELNQIPLETLKSLSGTEEAKHWQDTYQFIEYAYDEWQIQIASSNKLSRANFQQQMFNAEISRLQNSPESHLIIAGIVPTNKTDRSFFSDILKLDNGHVILPYAPMEILKQLLKTDNKKIKPEHPLYGFIQFYKYLSEHNNKNNILKIIKPISCSNIIDHKVSNSKPSDRFNSLLGFGSSLKSEPNTQPIDYIQFDSIYDEAEYVGVRCKKILQINPEASIAIINSSLECKNIYKNTIQKYVPQMRDLMGDRILENNAVCLLLDWAEFSCHSFNLNKFFKLISNPEIASNETICLKKLILKTNRFASNLAEIQEILTKENDKILSSQELANTKFWFDKYSNLFAKITSNNFTKILRTIIRNIEKIKPNIWAKYERFKLSDAIRDLYQTNWQSKNIRSEEFPELLRSCMENARIFMQANQSKIVIGRLSDTNLAQFDHVFIVDASEGNLPPSIKENPWLNKRAREELEIYLNSNIYSSSIYNFYLDLSSPSVCITRSSKQLSGKDSVESSLLLQIKLHSSAVTEYTPFISDSTIKHNRLREAESYVFSDQFPEQISATDIETLIHAPYNFYAKKILNLRAFDNLDDYPSLAEFGNFFHAVAEQYTNQYDEIKSTSTGAKIEIFNHIASSLLAAISIPDYSRATWIIKLAATAPEFVEFEGNRRKNCTKIYTELRGKIELSIAGKKLKIIAIADRIEISKNGKAIILDYKTGSPPTKTDVLSGKSPQLIIEALIMKNGSFNNRPYNVDSVIYVKVASSKPYLRLTEIKLNDEQLTEHMEGLNSLLEHYITTGKYPLAKCDLKYDDYKHLARR